MLNSNPSLNDMNNLNKISKWICLLPLLSLLVSLPSQSQGVKGAEDARPQLGPKLRQRLKRDKFPDLPDNPTMLQVQRENLDDVDELDLTDLGDSDNLLTLEGIVDHLPNLKRLDLRRARFDHLHHLDNHLKLEALNLSELPNHPQAEIDALFKDESNQFIKLHQPVLHCHRLFIHCFYFCQIKIGRNNVVKHF